MRSIPPHAPGRRRLSRRRGGGPEHHLINWITAYSTAAAAGSNLRKCLDQRPFVLISGAKGGLTSRFRPQKGLHKIAAEPRAPLGRNLSLDSGFGEPEFRNSRGRTSFVSTLRLDCGDQSGPVSGSSA